MWIRCPSFEEVLARAWRSGFGRLRISNVMLYNSNKINIDGGFFTAAALNLCFPRRKEIRVFEDLE